MHYRITKLLFAVLALALLGACGAKHSSRAILYEAPTGTSVFSLVQTKPTYSGDVVINKLASGNPIRLPKGKVYDLNINELRPGWIHLRQNPNLNVSQTMSTESTGTTGTSIPAMVGPNPFTVPNIDSDWSSTQEKFLVGKEIWLLVEITQTNPKDPLELSSGKYVSASNVKLDMYSYGSVPFSSDERRVFHIDQSSSYRITFKVYEIKGVKFKQALARVYDNPGLFGLASSTVDTVKNVFMTIVGPSLFHTDEKGTMLIETALLGSDGTMEFKGTVNILRTDGNEDIAHEYMLYDAVKSDFYREKDKCVTGFNDHNGYKNALNIFAKNCGTVDLLDKENGADKYSYLRFSVSRWEEKKQ